MAIPQTAAVVLAVFVSKKIGFSKNVIVFCARRRTTWHCCICTTAGHFIYCSFCGLL